MLFILRQTAHFRVPLTCPELQNRVPGSRSVECEENRNSRGKHFSTGQLWQWRCGTRTCLVCFVSANTCLALVPTVILLELHLVNNIYRLHLVIEDISLFGGIITLKWEFLLHMDPYTLFKVIQKTGQRPAPLSPFSNPARAEASELLGILQIIDCCASSSALFFID